MSQPRQSHPRVSRRRTSHSSSLLGSVVEALERRELLAVAINLLGSATAPTSSAGITQTPDGNLWFTDPTGELDRITPSGSIMTFSTSQSGDQTGISSGAVPTGITSGPDGTLWFTEYGAKSLNPLSPVGDSGIGRYVPSTGEFTEFTAGLTDGSGPDDITLGPDGNFWFTENVGGRIGRITPQGTITEFSTGLAGDSKPVGIVTGPDGALWFTESNTDLIGRIDPNTGQITQFGQGQITADAAPTGITVGADGALWFTEIATNTGRSAIGRITTAGAVTESLVRAGSQPAGIVSGPDNALYFTEEAPGTIGRITLAGAYTELAQGVGPTAGPASITNGPDGELWFTELNGTHIGRISTIGVLNQYPGTQVLPTNGGPDGITAGPDNALYFTDGDNNAIGRIDTAGNITEDPVPQTVSVGQNLTLGPDGALWFVDGASATGTTDNGGIGRITTTGQVTLYSQGITGRPSADGTTVYPATPVAITSGPDGNLWYTDDAGQIGRITPLGVVTQFRSNILPGSFLDGITTGSDGNLWFTDNGPDGAGPASVGRITPQGTVTLFTDTFGSASLGRIVAGPSNLLDFVDSGNNVLGSINTAGQYISNVPVPGAGGNAELDGLAVGPDGAIYLNKSDGDNIIQFNTDGTTTTLDVPYAAGGDNLYGMAAGPDGNIWFSDQSTTALIGQVVLPQTSVVETASAPLALAPGQAFNSVLASFTDKSTVVTSANFTSTINYGDGQTATGALVSVGNGGFTITGEHAYATAGNYTITVTISNPAGQATPLTIQAVVTAPVVPTLSFVVTNTNDSGAGSLRQAILNANSVGGHAITFAIPDQAGGIESIAPLTPLPVIAEPTSLDGATEAASLGMTSARILVQINGSLAGATEGLVFVVGSDGSTLNDIAIFGFEASQVVVESDDDTIEGSDIGFGLATDGTLLNLPARPIDDGSDGVLVTGMNEVIGGNSGQGNVISGNLGSGLQFFGAGADQSTVVSNLIGTDPTGTKALPNLVDGIVINGGAGFDSILSDVISGNGDIGVEIDGVGGNLIRASMIGVDVTGTKAIGNGTAGICIDDESTLNTIGIGTLGDLIPGEANVISGNGVTGISIQNGSFLNQVMGNLIGTNLAGTAAIGNGVAGILISDSPKNLVGTGNLISGNGTVMSGAGIWIDGPASVDNVVFGNAIGTDITGNKAIPNAVIGVLINQGSDNVIGDTGYGPDNEISGNGLFGVMIADTNATGNRVQANLIGTNLSGTAKLGNGTSTSGGGVYLLNAPGNLIGGAGPNQFNVISGNGFDGIELFGPGATGNTIDQNRIGTDVTGTLALGNGNDGVVLDMAPLNVIQGNIIAANGLDGITVSGPETLGQTINDNLIGQGIGGQPLGNGTFGILIVNQATGPLVGTNANVNNALGPVRNTNVVANPTTTPVTSKKVVITKVKAAARPVEAFHSKAKSKVKK